MPRLSSVTGTPQKSAGGWLGLGIARIVVDPFSYWINTSAPEDVAAFEALVRSGRSPLEAVCELAGVDPREILGERSSPAPELGRMT